MDQEAARALPEGQRVTDDAETIASIGERIRELRRAKRLTLARIAAETGLSIGHLSQVERGISAPSIRHLQLIASALGVKIGWFFDGPDAAPAAERGVIVRADRRKKLSYSGLGLTDYLLSPNLSGKLELLLCELDPGAESGADYYAHEGEEAGLIIEGSLELWVGDNQYLLVEGDSFTFASATPHRYRNPGRALTRIVWVVTPPSF
jgi:transcriptional regulator with XRE-family HTH domain